MAINTLATATLFQTTLDKIAVQEATPGWMDDNTGQELYIEITDIREDLLLWNTKPEK